MKTLKQVKVGETVKVVKLHGEALSNAELWIWASQRVLKFTSEKLLRSEIRLKLL